MVFNLPDGSSPGEIVDPDGRQIIEVVDPDGNVVWTTDMSSGVIVEDFEDGDISEYSGDTGSFAATTNDPQEGTYGLETTSSWYQNISSGSGLDNYPVRGQEIEWYSAVDSITGGWQRQVFRVARQNADCNYYFRLNWETDEISVNWTDAGGWYHFSVVSIPFTLNANTYYRQTLLWDDGSHGGSVGDMTYTLYDANSSDSVSVTGWRDDWDGGGIGFAGDGSATCRFDNVSIITNQDILGASFTASSFTADPDASVTFDAATSYSSATITDYQWDFGDGTTATGESVSHSYSSAGDYTVTLTVDDDAGRTDTSTRTVTVETPVVTIDDFEDGDLSEYNVDTSHFNVQTGTVLDGSYALEGPSTDTVMRIAGDESTGLNATPEIGDTWELYFTVDNKSNAGDGAYTFSQCDASAPLDNSYFWRYRFNDPYSMYLSKYESGNLTQIGIWDTSNVTWSEAPSWNRVVFDSYSDTNGHHFDVEAFNNVSSLGGGDSMGTNTFTDSDSTFSSGGFGWYLPYNMSDTIYYDEARIL